MVNQALIQSKAAKGYAKAAEKVGAMANQFRPTGLIDPLGETPFAQLPMAFDTKAKFPFEEPLVWDRPMDFVLMDTTDVKVGDLLQGADYYFVCRFDPFRPPAVVRCNSIISIFGNAEDGENGGAGDGGSSSCPLSGYQPGYSTPQQTSTDAVCSGWPCEIEMEGNGLNNESKIPGTMNNPKYRMWLPVMPNDWRIQRYMTVADNHGNTYRVFGTEVSQFGTKVEMFLNGF